MEDLVRVRIANAAEYSRIGQGSLQRPILSHKRRSKGSEIARKDVDAARIDQPQRLFSLQNMKRCPAFAARLREHQRTFRKVEGGKSIAARQLRSRRSPVQPARDHQVQHQPEIVIEAEGDALADPPQLPDDLALSIGDWRLSRPHQERACHAHTLQRTPKDARSQSADVRRDVGQLRHKLQCEWD